MALGVEGRPPHAKRRSGRFTKSSSMAFSHLKSEAVTVYDGTYP
jgi:hypothetical protein